MVLASEIFGKIISNVGIIALIVPIFSGCSGNYDVHSESRIALGTVVEITVASADEEAAREAVRLAFDEFERVEGLISSYRPDSEIGILNRESEAELSDEVFDLLSRSLEISAASGGAFDVTVGPLMDLWRFDEGGAVPGEEDLKRALAAVGYEKLQLQREGKRARLLVPGMKVDLGAIGKGYAVDRAAEILRREGIENAIVDAGGDIRLLGRRPGKDFWRIGIRHPRDPARLLLSLDLADRSVVTSGDYERFFMAGDVRYHHLLDPKSGLPARGCQSVTVVAAETAEADAYATAAFVMGPVRGLAFLRSMPGVEGVIVGEDGVVLWTDEERLRR